MTKAQIAVLEQMLARVQTRAASTPESGEALWLHTYIIPALQQILGQKVA